MKQLLEIVLQRRARQQQPVPNIKLGEQLEKLALAVLEPVRLVNDQHLHCNQIRPKAKPTNRPWNSAEEGCVGQDHLIRRQQRMKLVRVCLV